MIKLHIFDADGTLLDSMPMWENLGRDYLTSKGVNVPDDLDERLETMTLEESSEWFFSELGVGESPRKIRKEMLAMIERGYREEVKAFPWASALLEEAASEGGNLVILSTSDGELLRAAFRRLDILGYFSKIYTSAELGEGKDGPEIFLKVCELEGVRPEDTMVYEDSEFAIRSATEAGCNVTPVNVRTDL